MRTSRDDPVTGHVWPDAAAGDYRVAGARCSRRNRSTMSDHGRAIVPRTVSRS